MQTWPAPPVPALPGRGQPVRVLETTGALTVAAEGPVALLYVCGITPYDATHLGHAATYIAFDLLHRAWLDAGLTVRYTSNVTDVDDPLLERATRDGVDWRTLAADQTALFAEDMSALAVLPPHSYLGAVETIPSLVDAVGRLLEEGTAYRVGIEPGAGGDDPGLGDVYADLGPQPPVDGIAGLDPQTALAVFAERGGDPDRPGKRSPLDPVLWRRERPGEPAWDGKGLGSGRPGWHIECAVIAERTLGPCFDVLGGGRDLAFPHHEMSAAHARALGGDGPRVRMHAGMVGLDGEKMSKSRGNLVLVSALRRSGVDPMAIRLAVLAHHYRDDWMWDDAVLETARQRLGRWRAAVAEAGGPDAAGTLLAVRAALAADLDAPQALRAVDAWVDGALSLEDPLDGGPDDDRPRDGGPVDGAPEEIRHAVDALLGVRL